MNTDRQRAIDDAKQQVLSRIPCTDFLEKSKDGAYCCPFCGSGKGKNRTGAVKYYPDTNTCFCHKCRKSADVIDLYQKKTGAGFMEALTELARQIGVDLERGEASTTSKVKLARSPADGRKGSDRTADTTDGKMQDTPSKKPQNESPDYTAYYEACKKILESPEGAAGMAYLEQRQVRVAALMCGVGFDPQADPANAPGAVGQAKRLYPCPRIIIPCSKGHYVARRTDGGTDRKKLNPKGSTPAIFNEKVLFAHDVQEVFVTEGAFDALSVMEAGGEAIALNSASNGKLLLAKLAQRGTDATFILCQDNDPDPKTAAFVQKEFDALAAGLQELNISFITANICNGLKDPNDALIADYPAFEAAVWGAMEDAKAHREKLRQEAQQAEDARKKRTGDAMVEDFLHEIRTEKYKPIPTGITDIDKALGGGFIRQWLVELGAAPGAGKTALAQWIFEGMAEHGVSCIYLNLEMSREQMIARSLARIAKRNGDRISIPEIMQGYKWDTPQQIIVESAAEEYKKTIAPRMIYNPDGVTTDIDRILQYITEEAQLAEAVGNPAPIVVLDYLQIVTGRPGEDETALIKRATAALKNYAIDHNTVVFLIIAHNRASNKTGSVTMESGRDTSALEYSADLQIGLTFTNCLKRGGDKTPDELTPEERKYKTLRITKGRWSAPGTEVDLIFDGESMTFTQVAERWEDPRSNAATSFDWRRSKI